MSVKNKALAIVFLLMSLVAGSLMYTVHRQMSINLASSLERYDTRVLSIYQDIMEDTERHFNARFMDLKNNRSVLQAFRQRERDRLLALMGPLTANLKGESPWLRFIHFYTPETHSLLRVHWPELYGDDLSADRFLIREVNRIRKPLRGLESGKSGILYRFAYPFYDGDRYLGVVEFNMDPAFISEKISRYMKVESAIIIHRDVLNQIFIDTHPLSGYAGTDDHILVESTDDLFKNLHSGEVLNGKPVRLPYGGRVYSIHTNLKLEDYTGENVGDVLTAQDITPILDDQLRLSLAILGVAVLLLLGSMIVLSFGFKRLIQRLEFSRARFKTIADNMGEGLYTTDPEGRVQFINGAALRLLGLSPEAVMGRSAHDTFHVENDDHSCPVHRAMVAGKTYKSEEHTYKTARGEILNVMMSATPIVRRGEVTGSVVVFSDITDRIQMEDDMRNFNHILADRVKEELDRFREQEKLLIRQSRMAAVGQLIGILSSQWRQPLNAIHLLAQDTMETHREGELDGKNLKRSMDEIQKSTMYILGTIDTFMGFFESSREPEIFHPIGAIEEILSLLAFQLSNHRMEMVTNLNQVDSFSISGFQSEFKQAILSLFAIIRGRVKNTRTGLIDEEDFLERGKIQITVENLEDEILILFRDHAGSVSRDDLNLWVESDTSNTRIEPGIDMIRTILENMGGSFEVQTTGDGILYLVRLRRVEPFFMEEE